MLWRPEQNGCHVADDILKCIYWNCCILIKISQNYVPNSMNNNSWIQQWFHPVDAKLLLEQLHYNYVIMTKIASQITSLAVVYSTVYSDADQRKHQSSASLAFVWGIHRDRWIPRTKAQLRGKCFRLMTSSCGYEVHLCIYASAGLNMFKSSTCILSISGTSLLEIPALGPWTILVLYINLFRQTDRQSICHILPVTSYDLH